MSNHITIELCTEDRARLDKLADRLEAVANLTAVLINQNTPTYKADMPSVPTPKIAEEDEITKKLKAALDRAKTPTETAEETTPTTTPIKEETPTQAEETEPIYTQISRTELGAKVRELMTKGYRDQVKAIIQSYAPTVPRVPEDKLNECYSKLVALEG